MLTRCNDEQYKTQHATYDKVDCCNEWLNFENFKNWMEQEENFNKILTEEFHLDKDIVSKGNKFYCPELCCLVPQKINKLFTKRDTERGIYPIGVCKKNQKYQARCNANGKNKYLGVFDSIEEAFLAYKNYKENIIKQIAQEEYYKGNITQKCYEAMMTYRVEITD